MHTTPARYQITATTPAGRSLATFAPNAAAARVLVDLMRAYGRAGTLPRLDHLGPGTDTVFARIDRGATHMLLIPEGPVGQLPTCCGTWLDLGDPVDVGIAVDDPAAGAGIPCPLCHTAWSRRVAEIHQAGQAGRARLLERAAA